MAAQPVDPIVPPEPTDLSNRALMALLRRHRACSEARDWLGGRDARAAWAECERGDHMLWIAAKLGVDRRLLARAAVACVQPAVSAYVPAEEPRPQAALDATLRWCDDPTTANMERVRAYAADASAYAADASADAADASAYAADASADAADASAYAAAAAAAVAYGAADADAFAAADASADAFAAAARREARAASLRRSARIVRELISFEVVLAAAKAAAS